MGCCFSSCREDDSSENADPNERTHLLADPVSNINTLHIQRVHSDDFLSQYPNSLPEKTDQISALNRILQETANNVIDVAALGAHNLEQHEYVERMKHYTQKLQTVAAVSHKWVQPRANPCLLVDIPAPDSLLAAAPISPSDYVLIKSTAEKATLALDDLKVEHKEDLVVPFNIP